MITYVSKMGYIWDLGGSGSCFVGHSWSARISYIHIKCYHFVKCSHLLGHFGALTMRSVFRGALAGDSYFRSVALMRAVCFLWH